MNKPTILLGDIHGDMKRLCAYLKWNKVRDITILQVGDFGFSIDAWHMQTEEKYKKTLEHYNKFFKTRGIDFYAIRGNHDNPAYFDGRFSLSNIKLLPDYTVLEFDNKRWLFVGGATSIDRLDRISRMNHGHTPEWWEDEVFALDKDKAYAAGKIDIVVTHTVPEGACNYQLVGRNEMLQTYVQDGDTNLVRDVKREQDLVQELYDILHFNGSELTHWYHGHFHKACAVDFKHTRFRCLAIDEMLEHR